jgi:predicted Holliday junction resolvase-like endonuclease
MKDFFNILNNKVAVIFIMLVLLIIWILIWIVIWKITKYWEVKRYKIDAIKRSKSAILWEVYEKIIPFLKNFTYNPKDMVFIWKWFDYLILDGLSAWDLKEIIFFEIKSGSSSLNKNERMIQRTILQKNIKYEEFRLE